MNKTFICCLLFCSFYSFSWAQKNVLRFGAGTTSEVDYNHKTQWGPLLSVEYQYDFSKYAGIQTRLSFASVNCNPNQVDTYLGGAAGLLVTPLPDKFRYIKIGANFLYHYHRYAYEYDGKFMLQNNSDVGFGFPIRAYLIDNHKHELSVGYDFITEFQQGEFFCLAHHLAVYFGLKF
ncbi:hypothetical protein [uncultured Bacteroides sp.]|jgi:hypothetical protein|uniref:hypothetical protein n=1 Tax=uncultured Bacteroides sp. TaxID=162156 RepID=UPI0026239923|nr:hypothetical protein [uncultured Bacteroides sp.]